jgi:hypothetical protein
VRRFLKFDITYFMVQNNGQEIKKLFSLVAISPPKKYLILSRQYRYVK